MRISIYYFNGYDNLFSYLFLFSMFASMYSCYHVASFFSLIQLVTTTYFILLLTNILTIHLMSNNTTMYVIYMLAFLYLLSEEREEICACTVLQNFLSLPVLFGLSCGLELQAGFIVLFQGFPSGSEGKASACNVGDPGLTPGLGRSSGEGNGNPLQYSCLGNPMNRAPC